MFNIIFLLFAFLRCRCLLPLFFFPKLDSILIFSFLSFVVFISRSILINFYILFFFFNSKLRINVYTSDYRNDCVTSIAHPFDRFTFQLICSIAIRSSSLVLFVLFVLLQMVVSRCLIPFILKIILSIEKCCYPMNWCTFKCVQTIKWLHFANFFKRKNEYINQCRKINSLHCWVNRERKKIYQNYNPKTIVVYMRSKRCRLMSRTTLALF